MKTKITGDIPQTPKENHCEWCDQERTPAELTVGQITHGPNAADYLLCSVCADYWRGRVQDSARGLDGDRFDPG